jgi:hypothetical protein
MQGTCVLEHTKARRRTPMLTRIARCAPCAATLIDLTIAVHQRRVVKSAAIEIQNAMVEPNALGEAGRRIEFRVGIHLIEEARY